MSNALQTKPRIFNHKAKVCIVASKYNEQFTDALVENTISELGELIPMARIDLIRVPGAFEIPVVVSKLIQRSDINCIITLGLIIRGHTQHADLVASSVTTSLQELAVQNCVPIIHEVLLVEDERQAHARCIAASMNRGREAARAAVAMIDVFTEIEKSIPKSSPNNLR
jgi:6,7-dimethyl-8-ribityllumazine synthase